MSAWSVYATTFRETVSAQRSGRRRWRTEGGADAAALLAAHPKLASNQRVVLELIYEEYCQRVDAGQLLDRARFCARFPGLEEDVRKLLEVHADLDRRSSLLDQVPLCAWPVLGGMLPWLRPE